MDHDCFCDYGDPPSVYRATMPRARKPHKCDECAGLIAVGERYERVFGVWENYPSTHLSCERCYDLRVWTNNNVPCFCPTHGDMDTRIEEAIADACSRAPLETVGLRFGYLRRKVLRDRHNAQPVRL